ncbi:hypothetical protein [Sphingomonas sp.]|uniref:hypothetical protein n=1 Tax=Sphingomonas sp. TaxID=28214 RepID=UPI0025F49164|nr:hypothetical protein [Sphingomonas sp.]MBV9527091.1 DUF1214 domain-containing protein [Sphingomonas sp.]
MNSADTLNAAWSAFCDKLKSAGETIARQGAGLDEEGIAEGYEHLAHLALDSLTWAMAPSPDFPRFVHLNDTPEIADNRFAPLRPDAAYRLTGRIDTLCDINISLHEGWPFLGGRRVWGDLGRNDLTVDPDGRFELVISAEPQEGDWLALPAEARILQIREYYTDWDAHRPGVFEIVRIGSEGEAPRRSDPTEVGARLRAVGPWLDGYLDTHWRLVQERITTVNGVAQPATAQAGNRNIWYGPGKFRLEPDEALLIAFAPPRARAWTIQWLLSPWYEPPDIANRATSLMSKDAVIGSDGIVRVVLSGADPCVPNWLDTGGRREGVIMLRWIWCEESSSVASTVVKRDRLSEHLPGDTPRITASERMAQQARRRTHWAKRAR